MVPTESASQARQRSTVSDRWGKTFAFIRVHSRFIFVPLRLFAAIPDSDRSSPLGVRLIVGGNARRRF